MQSTPAPKPVEKNIKDTFLSYLIPLFASLRERTPSAPTPTEVLAFIHEQQAKINLSSALDFVREQHARIDVQPALTFVRAQSNRIDLSRAIAYAQSAQMNAYLRQLLISLFKKKWLFALTYSKHRKTTDYATNIAASIELPRMVRLKPLPKINPNSTMGLFTKTKIKPEPIETIPLRKQVKTIETQIKGTKEACIKDSLLLQKIELVEDIIKRHATTRMDLFFYLLVAVYNKNVTVNKGHTNKQHGKGSTKHGTAACHSSLFPHVELEKIPSENTIIWLYRQVFPEDKVSLEDTVLDDSNNITYELPTIVNNFDSCLEWVYCNKKYQKSPQIKACIGIANQVAKGEIDPREGMNLFLKVINAFLGTFEVKFLAPHRTETPRAMRKVYQCQKEGMLLVTKPDSKGTLIDDDYIYMMLRLTPEEKNKVKKDPALLKGHYLKIQEEIFAAKPGAPKPKP